MHYKAYRIIVTGIVQGVGFRPFIHRLAFRYGLDGYVRNVGGSEVEIWVEGPSERVENFVRSISEEKPPPAVIEELIVDVKAPKGYSGFRILPSSHSRVKYSMIPPDIGICRGCLREILDPNDRRYRYPFNSCAWCGPRFSMMYRAPYDRENTSMAKYKLCSDCLREYNDIGNIRRYHAQGISCPKDGPKLWLTDRDGEPVEASDPIREAAKLIGEGYIVAVKGLGGYHIACLATSDDVVAELRKRKGRPSKPFAVMALDISVAERLVYIDDTARSILESPTAPIVLLPKREDTPVSTYVSPGLTHEGVFLAYTGLHYLLLMETRDKFLVMTSGNRHGKPMCINEDCAYRELRGIVDYYLVHDREIVNRVDDSVIRFTYGRPVLLRRSRGFAPVWIRLPRNLNGTYIAFGSDLQTAGAVGFSDKVVLTQYIGDLDSVDALMDLDKYLGFFIRNYSIELSKSLLVIDKHPRYSSRELAYRYREKYGANIIEVQHHVAHIVSVAIDRGLEGRFIGIAIDGAGYGDDGAIWGGEVLYVDLDNGTYKRMGHLEYQPLDSDRSTVYPVRFVFSILAHRLGLAEALRVIEKHKLLNCLPYGRTELEFLYNRLEHGDFVWTSSTGRVLDGVSSLLRICCKRTYEGEPAIMLEAFSRGGRFVEKLPRLHISSREGLFNVLTTDMYLDLLELLEEGVSPKDLAYSIQYSIGYSLGSIAGEACKGLRGLEGTVVVSGGAAVNDFIIEGIGDALRDYGLDLFLPKRVPANDGGIAVGQIAWADALARAR